MAVHTHMLTGLDSEKAMLDIFFSGFMSGAGSAYQTIAIEGLSWTEEDASRFAEEQAKRMTAHAIDDPARVPANPPAQLAPVNLAALVGDVVQDFAQFRVFVMQRDMAVAKK